MGLSANQAKLLTITARLSDNELRAQFITNAKVRLAESSNEATTEYMRALDGSDLMYSFYDADNQKNSMKLTAGALMTFGENKNQYGLINTAGQILISSDDIEKFQTSTTLKAYLDQYNVTKVHNPLSDIYLTELYGENFDKYFDPANKNRMFDQINNKADVFFSTIATKDADGKYVINGINTNDAYDHAKYTALNNAMKALMGTGNGSIGKWDTDFSNTNPDLGGIMGNMALLLADKPEFVDLDSLYPNGRPGDPISWADFLAQKGLDENATYPGYGVDPPTPPTPPSVNGAASESCYSAVGPACGYGVAMYHMEHNLSPLLYGSAGLLKYLVDYGLAAQFGVGNGTTDRHINNSDNSITITAASGTRDSNASSYPKTAQLAQLLAYNATLTSPTGDAARAAINEVLDIYCRAAAYHNGDFDANFTVTKTGSAPADTTTAGTMQPDGSFGPGSDQALFNDWENFWTDTIANIAFDPVPGTPEYNSYQAALTAYNSALTAFNNSALSDEARWNAIHASDIANARSEYQNLVSATLRDQAAWDAAWQTNVGAFQTWIDNYTEIKENVIEALKQDIERTIPNEKDPKVQWYTNLWYRMGGETPTQKADNHAINYKVLEDKYLDNEAWLQWALETGTISMEQVIFNEKGSEKHPNLENREWKSISLSNSSDIKSEQDQRAITRAEVKYEKNLREIQSKDKQYDNDLKRLDTQHTALQQEYESLKAITDKNIERSFKAFS